ncbi:ribosome maturation factor RimM [Actibacterium lipolyticum]|uniref:Ribosome maturation factor RimM n=1 Tax=Actibacterium lipolyticum TaxID=1524263 RepID=A0A238KSC8_9RHOB|nr:ribosome maturation factor RimM [Actibacterium lipolyticum]SMX45618.1 Ribosome maturation factor RimM [Actibacterium lipolyticum]
MTEERICVGAISGSFGVRGEVRLKSFCADPEAIGDYAPLYSEDGTKTYTLQITRAVKGGFAAKLSGLTTKEEADAMKGTRLFANRDALPDLPDDEFYHTDLIGLEVLDTGGKSLGHVRAVHNHGASDLLEIHGPNLKATVLLPFTNDAVPTVDLTAGRIIADPPEGLIPDE